MTSTGGSQPEISNPEDTHGIPETGVPRNQGWYRGTAQNAGPTESAPLWSTQVPEPEWLKPGKCIKPRATSDSSQQSNLEPEHCRQGKHTHREWGHTHREWGQTQCGRDTASTRQGYLFAASLPPHSTTEQVSLKKKKVSSTIPFVSGRKPDTGDQQTEEAITEGNALEATGHRLKPCG